MAEIITASQVKSLRDQTGAGIMDCKRALVAAKGNMAEARDWLRQQGMMDSIPPMGRSPVEGIVASYIHTGNRIGVLVELNCQTGEVAKDPDFHGLAHNIAMQIAACPQVIYVQRTDIPEGRIARERGLELGQKDLAGLDEDKRSKVVEDRLRKRLADLCLLSQPYIRDQSLDVEELLQKAIARFGETIQVRRFSRFTLGEDWPADSD